MIAIWLLSLYLSVNPTRAIQPATIYLTARTSEPVSGTVCFQAYATDPNSWIQFRESCEDINGQVKQIRWHGWRWGTYLMRVVLRVGNQVRLISHDTEVVISDPGSGH